MGLMALHEYEAELRETQVRGGDRAALAALYTEHRDQLKRWVEMRLDPRVWGRLSPSDVVQEVYLAAEQRLDHFRGLPDMPFSVWVRLIAGQRLIDAHRFHLGAEARNAAREVALGKPGPATSAVNLASRIAGDLTSPSQAAVRHEEHEMLIQAIEAMPAIDREILSLRHFDEMSNDEVALLLDIPKSTASKRYVRALARLKSIIEQIPGMLENLS